MSDGIAATGFTPGALASLRQKRSGRYLIAELDPAYAPPTQEARELFGVRMVQARNDYLPTAADFNVVVGDPELVDQSIDDLRLAVVAMKYSVSNNIVIASGGRTLAISAGQQSRILSTKLACSKFERYMRLQHPEIVELTRSSIKKLTDKVAQANRHADTLSEISLELFDPVILGSDGFVPFSDNIEAANRYNVKVIVEPEGALRSSEIEAAARSHGMALVRTKHRHFYH